MIFNPDNKRYIEITPDERNTLLLKNGQIEYILKQRI